MHAFRETIANWEDWGRLFQSKEAFSPLIQAIYLREALPFSPLAPLTPGSNAVFAVGNTVCKVFAPDESSAPSEQDYQTEIHAMRAAQDANIPAPKVLASGALRDKYLFRYIIMERAQGHDAGPYLKTLPQDIQTAFARAIGELYAQLHALPEPQGVPCLEHGDPLIAKRWGSFSPSFLTSLLHRREALAAASRCYVHGDITAENVLLCRDGSFMLIDFADSLIAPPCYDLGPILLDLFSGSVPLARAFCQEDDLGGLVRQLTDGIALHHFGGNIAEFFLRAHTQHEPGQIRDLAHLEALLCDHYRV